MINLNFLDAEGNPIPGRVPTPVIVSGGTLTKEQTGELAGIYGGYTAVMQMSLISVNMQKGVFSGGKYAIVSNGVFDTIYVELEGGDENTAPRGLGAYPKNTANNTTWNYPVVFATDSYQIVVSNPDQVAVTAEPPTYAGFEPQYWTNADGDTCTVNAGLAFWCSGGDGNQYSEVEITTVPELQPNGITTSNYMLLPVIEPDSNNKFFVSANTVYNNEGAVVHTFEADTIDNTIQQGVRKATQLPQIISEDGDEIILQAKDTLNWVPQGAGYSAKYRRQWYEVLALNSSGVALSLSGRYDVPQYGVSDLNTTANSFANQTGANVGTAIANFHTIVDGWTVGLSYVTQVNGTVSVGSWNGVEPGAVVPVPTHVIVDRTDQLSETYTLAENNSFFVGRLPAETTIQVNNNITVSQLCRGDVGSTGIRLDGVVGGGWWLGDWTYYERKRVVNVSEQQNSEVTLQLPFFDLKLWKHVSTASNGADATEQVRDLRHGYRDIDGRYVVNAPRTVNGWLFVGDLPADPPISSPDTRVGVVLSDGPLMETGYVSKLASVTAGALENSMPPTEIQTTDTASTFDVSMEYDVEGAYVIACDTRLGFLLWVEWKVSLNYSVSVGVDQGWDLGELGFADHIVTCTVKAVYNGNTFSKALFAPVTVNKVPVRYRRVTGNWYWWPTSDPFQNEMHLYTNYWQFAGPEVYTGIDNIFLGQGLSKDFAGYNSDEDESRMIFSKRIVLGNDGIDWMMDKYGISANLPNGTGRRYYYSDELYEKICNTTYLIQFDQSGFSDWVLNVDALPPASKGSAPDIDAICFRV